MIRPEITVAAVIQGVSALGQDPDSYLMVEEDVRGALVLNQPAGHVEHDETPLQAVIREVHEETRWHFRPTALIGSYLWRSPRTDDYILRLCFCGEAVSEDTASTLDEGIVAAHWLHEDLVRSSERLRSPFVIACLQDYQSGKRAALETVTLLP